MRNKLWLVYVAIASVATLGYFATGHVSVNARTLSVLDVRGDVPRNAEVVR